MVHTKEKEGVSMKLWKCVLLTVIFIFLSLYCLLYGYALFHHLSLDEQRKNITLYDINGEVLYESNFKKNMSWTPLEDIPQFLQDAVVSVEDKRFYTHAGIDPIRITKALAQNIAHGHIVEGGSTITQQYAKNLFLTNEQTLVRKIHELLYAIRLEMQYSKQEILEGYLNTAYFGHGIYGIQAAADYFFNTSLDQLTIAQSAMLIGIPNGPSLYSPFLNPKLAKERQTLILDVLEHNHVITPQQKKFALSENIRLSTKTDTKLAGMEQYYVDAVLQTLNQMDIDFQKEVHVYTYYDPSIQQALDQSIKAYTTYEDEIEVAAIITQPFSGNVLAMAGGKDYTLSQYNRAMYSSRQVASTIKPLLYYCALQNGFTPTSTFLSQPTTFHGEDGEEYAPTNYDNLYANDEITMINALALSDNIYAEKMHLFLGMQTLHEALLDFGITQSQPSPSQALGTVNMSLLELSRIYNTFAGEGLYIKPALISKISSPDGIQYERKITPKRLLDRDETLVLNQMLTATYDLANKSYNWPSMYGYQPKVTTAVKSGTSDWDSLVIGYNPEYTVGVWSGFDDNRTLDKQYYSLSKRIYQNTFNLLYEKRKGVWYEPSNRIIEKRINPISGAEISNGSVYWFLPS
jgi:hypothetical protein